MSDTIMKPNKSIRKRIRVTRTGKLIRRRAGHDHFNAKASRRRQRRQRAMVAFPKSFERHIRARL